MHIKKYIFTVILAVEMILLKSERRRCLECKKKLFWISEGDANITKHLYNLASRGQNIEIWKYNLFFSNISKFFEINCIDYFVKLHTFYCILLICRHESLRMILLCHCLWIRLKTFKVSIYFFEGERTIILLLKCFVTYS